MKHHRWSILFWQLTILATILLIWEYATQVPWIARHIIILDPFFVSTPSRIYERFFELSDPAMMEVTLFERVFTTMYTTILGFIVGVSTGFLAGLFLGWNRYFAAVLEPFIIALNSMPRIALVPLVVIMFGFGLLPKIVTAWLIVFFVVFFNTFAGVRNVDPDFVNTARMLGASQWQIIRSVHLPSALAWTFASLTPAISFALIGVVIGEFFGQDTGVGALIVISMATLEAADMWVSLILLGIMGILMVLLMRRVEAYLLRWQPRFMEREESAL